MMGCKSKGFTDPGSIVDEKGLIKIYNAVISNKDDIEILKTGNYPLIVEWTFVDTGRFGGVQPNLSVLVNNELKAIKSEIDTTTEQSISKFSLSSEGLSSIKVKALMNPNGYVVNEVHLKYEKNDATGNIIYWLHGYFRENGKLIDCKTTDHTNPSPPEGVIPSPFIPAPTMVPDTSKKTG